MSIHAFDLNSDGVCELITGWSNGKVSQTCTVGVNRRNVKGEDDCRAAIFRWEINFRVGFVLH